MKSLHNAKIELHFVLALLFYLLLPYPSITKEVNTWPFFNSYVIYFHRGIDNTRSRYTLCTHSLRRKTDYSSLKHLKHTKSINNNYSNSGFQSPWGYIIHWSNWPQKNWSNGGINYKKSVHDILRTVGFFHIVQTALLMVHHRQKYGIITQK